jgi:hypothetical protein
MQEKDAAKEKGHVRMNCSMLTLLLLRRLQAGNSKEAYLCSTHFLVVGDFAQQVLASLWRTRCKMLQAAVGFRPERTCCNLLALLLLLLLVTFSAVAVHLFVFYTRVTGWS